MSSVSKLQLILCAGATLLKSVTDDWLVLGLNIHVELDHSNLDARCSVNWQPVEGRKGEGKGGRRKRKGLAFPHYFFAIKRVLNAHQ